MRFRSLTAAIAVLVVVAACSAPAPTAVPDHLMLDEIVPTDTTKRGGFGSGHSISPVPSAGTPDEGSMTESSDGGFGSGHITDPGSDSTGVRGTGGFGSGH